MKPYVVALVLLALAAPLRAQEGAGEPVVARIKPDRGPLELQQQDGNPVGALQLVKRRGRHGLSLVTADTAFRDRQTATLDLDGKTRVTMECLTVPSGSVRLTTCAAEDRRLGKKLDKAERVQIRFTRDGTEEAPLLEVELRDPELAHLLRHVAES